MTSVAKVRKCSLWASWVEVLFLRLGFQENKFAAAIGLIGVLGKAGVGRAILAQAHGADTVGANAKFYQAIPDAQCASFAERAIVFLGAPFIAVALDQHLVLWALSKGAGHRADFAVVVRMNLGAVEAEVNGFGCEPHDPSACFQIRPAQPARCCRRHPR